MCSLPVVLCQQMTIAASKKGMLAQFGASWLGVILLTVFFGIPSLFFLLMLHNRFQAVETQRMVWDVLVAFLLPFLLSGGAFLLKINCLGCIFVAVALVQFAYLMFVGWRWNEISGD